MSALAAAVPTPLPVTTPARLPTPEHEPAVKPAAKAPVPEVAAAVATMIPEDDPTPISTSIFDLFKIGPGPSSSHTIGPMKVAVDFLKDVKALIKEKCPTEKVRVEIHLFGSLSLTGRGHKTDTAIVGGLMNWMPDSCDPDALTGFLTEAGQRYLIPIFRECGDGVAIIDPSLLPASSPAHSESTQASPTAETRLGDSLKAVDVQTTEQQPEGDGGPFYPLEDLSVSAENFIWHPPTNYENLFHPNTMAMAFTTEGGEVLLRTEYYSVGGGFIHKEGCIPEGVRDTIPKYTYRIFDEFKKIMAENPEKTWPQLMLENEIALTGATEEEVWAKLDKVIAAMEASVVRGLNTKGLLPGYIGMQRRAGHIYEKAKREAYRADSFLTFLNAYAQAASEENAAGRTIVTAPTAGSSGVFPGLVYFMKHHLFYPQQVLRDSMMVAGCVGFLVKRNSSISGAEMGCMGEVGVASSMGAAMLTYAAGGDTTTCEAAAEIALEHHLGLTCDPVGGFVIIPCIQRNPMGAAKAYNAYVLAVSSDASLQKVSLDTCIRVMRETGQSMDTRYKETSEAGLAIHFAGNPC